MQTLREIYIAASHSRIIQLVIIAVVIDTAFGILRAIKDRNFNSCFGINGAIRKIGMIISIMFLIVVDYVTNFNLIGFIPETIRIYLGNSVGITEFFGMLYIAYEIVSILKNMTLCGLPVKKIWAYVKNFLGKYTDELPDDNELTNESEDK